ncbi:hypothetical protein DFP73DRAFT_586690, partial [Morchella snyderi]
DQPTPTLTSLDHPPAPPSSPPPPPHPPRPRPPPHPHPPPPRLLQRRRRPQGRDGQHRALGYCAGAVDRGVRADAVQPLHAGAGGAVCCPRPQAGRGGGGGGCEEGGIARGG